MEPYVTAGVVAFAILLGFAAFTWFLWCDDNRMEREELDMQEIEQQKKADVLVFRRSA